MTKSTYVFPLQEDTQKLFTIIDPRGEDLHSHLVELNRVHADNEVKKETGEKLVSELERIRDNIQDSGVSQRDMEEVEATSGLAMESYPISGFTTRRSKTGLDVALEAIDVRRASLIVGGIVAGLAFIWKIISWMRNRSSEGGVGGTALGNSAKDTESKKEMEDVAEEIEQKPANSNPLDGKSNDQKKVLQEEAAKYLSTRTIFVEKLMMNNPTYSKAFAEFVPVFADRFNKEAELLDKVVNELDAFASIGSDAVSTDDVNKLKALEQSLNDADFSSTHWEGFERFIKACGLREGFGRSEETLRARCNKLFEQFKADDGKPSRMNYNSLQRDGFKAISTDLKNIMNAIGDQEDSAGTPERYYYISKDIIENHLNEMNSLENKLKSLADDISEKYSSSTSSDSLAALMALNSIVSKIGGRIATVQAPVSINELFGSTIHKMRTEALNFSKKHVAINTSK